VSVTTFTTVNGRILRQNKDGVVHNFVSDPLGSVVMVRDTSGNTVYEAEYDPYGNVQSETGTNPSSLGYVGTLGYIKDSASSMYVRARYLLSNLGRWLTKDPLWPDEPGYVYVGARPTLDSDALGEKPSKTKPESESKPKLGPVRPCSCPGNVDFRVGYVYIDCSCRGKPIGILPEFGSVGLPGSDTFNIDPKCGKWIKADAIHFSPPMKPKPGLYKIKGLFCVVVSCRGNDWGADYCLVPILADYGFAGLVFQAATHNRGRKFGSFESRKFDEAKCGPPFVH
jgi:RHS repeat-associated protein